MKKIISYLTLAAILCTSLTGCTKDKKKAETTTSTESKPTSVLSETKKPASTDAGAVEADFPFTADWVRFKADRYCSDENLQYVQNVYHASVGEGISAVYNANEAGPLIMGAPPKNFSVMYYDLNEESGLDDNDMSNKPFTIIEDIEFTKVLEETDDYTGITANIPTEYQSLSEVTVGAVALNENGEVVDVLGCCYEVVDRQQLNTVLIAPYASEYRTATLYDGKIMACVYATNDVKKESYYVGVSDNADYSPLRDVISSKTPDDRLAIDRSTLSLTLKSTDQEFGSEVPARAVVTNKTDKLVTILYASKYVGEDVYYMADCFSSHIELYPGESSYINTNGRLRTCTHDEVFASVWEEKEPVGCHSYDIFGHYVGNSEGFTFTGIYQGSSPITIPAGYTVEMNSQYRSDNSSVGFPTEAEGVAVINGVSTGEDQKLLADLTLQPGDTVSATLSFSGSEVFILDHKDLKEKNEVSAMLKFSDYESGNNIVFG